MSLGARPAGALAAVLCCAAELSPVACAAGSERSLGSVRRWALLMCAHFGWSAPLRPGLGRLLLGIAERPLEYWNSLDLLELLWRAIAAGGGL